MRHGEKRIGEMRRGWNSEEKDLTCPEKRHFPEPLGLKGVQLPHEDQNSSAGHLSLWAESDMETPPKNMSWWGSRQPQSVPVLSRSKGRPSGNIIKHQTKRGPW